MAGNQQVSTGRGRRTDKNRKAVAARAAAQRPRTRRRQEADNKPLLNAQTTTFGLLLLALFVLGILLGGTLKVNTVQIVGTNLPINRITSASGVIGENIFAVKSDEVVRRLADIPSINLDRVSTALPDKVVVYATLRPSVAAWQTPHGLTLLSTDGIPLITVKSTNLPIITGGSRPPTSDMLVAVRYAASTLPAAPDGGLQGFAQDDKGLAVLGKSGWRAELGTGSAQALGLRVATLRQLLRKVARKGRQIKYADLRFKQPYVILR